MSRTLNDDFEDEDAPAGPLDLGTGSQVGTGVQSGYDDGGIDFDDELYGDDGVKGALELDVPAGRPGSNPQLAPPDLAPSSRKVAVSAPPSSKPNVSAPPPSSGRSLPAPVSSGQVPAAHSSGQLPSMHGGSDPHVATQQAQAPQPPPPPAPPTPAAVIAKYPAAPEKILQAPMYAVRVVMRQFELRSDLESLRRRRSPDVPLYEAALKAYDKKTFTLGMAMNISALTLATLIFFLPVFIRFLRND